LGARATPSVTLRERSLRRFMLILTPDKDLSKSSIVP
jgi:hypothetical protein